MWPEAEVCHAKRTRLLQFYHIPSDRRCVSHKLLTNGKLETTGVQNEGKTDFMRCEVYLLDIC